MPAEALLNLPGAKYEASELGRMTSSTLPLNATHSSILKAGFDLRNVRQSPILHARPAQATRTLLVSC